MKIGYFFYSISSGGEVLLKCLYIFFSFQTFMALFSLQIWRLHIFTYSQSVGFLNFKVFVVVIKTLAGLSCRRRLLQTLGSLVFRWWYLLYHHQISKHINELGEHGCCCCYWWWCWRCLTTC